MARRCVVCDSPDLIEIEADMASGMGVNPIAAKYGVSKSAASRHRMNCIALNRVSSVPLPPKAKAKPEPRPKAQTMTAEVSTAVAMVNSTVLPPVTSGTLRTRDSLVEALEASMALIQAEMAEAAATGRTAALIGLTGVYQKGLDFAAKLQALNAPPAVAVPQNTFSVIISPPEAWNRGQGSLVLGNPAEVEAAAKAKYADLPDMPWMADVLSGSEADHALERDDREPSPIVQPEVSTVVPFAPFAVPDFEMMKKRS